MKKTKLNLKRETIRILSGRELSSAAGGYMTQACSEGVCHTDNCTVNCQPPPSDGCTVTNTCPTFGDCWTRF